MGCTQCCGEKSSVDGEVRTTMGSLEVKTKGRKKGESFRRNMINQVSLTIKENEDILK